MFQWGIGLISVPLDLIIQTEDARDVMQNIVEWNFALSMNANFFVTYLLFKHTGARVNMQVN